MVKQFYKVPFRGASVVWDGVDLVAERLHGRRNQIQTVLVREVSTPADTDLPTPNPGGTP